MRIQQQQEEQMRIQRIQQEMRRQQEEAERQRQEQLQRQQQEEQMRIQMQQQEAAERQRQEQIQRQEMERQQQMMMQQQSMSQISSSSTTTKSGAIEEDLEEQKRREYEEWFKSQEREALEYSACVNYQEKASEVQNVGKTTTITEITEQQTFSQQQQSSHQTVHNSSKSGTNQGFAVESRPEPLLSESQLAQPPMSSSSLFESSQSQSSKEVYESQQFSGGVMKGYTLKQDHATEQRETGEKMLNSGVFGGIGADNNSLVDSEVDYKKHTVKDLAKHFALVKPKADIPHAILPEQRMYNGDQGPALNYLGASAQGSSSSTQSFMKKEISQEDFEASKKAYEMKKKQQQMESQQQTQSGSSQSSVVRRTETSSSSQQTKSQLNERRQSLTSSLMLDPAAAHAESGIIDPSAILRGSDTAGTRSRSEGLFGQTAEPG